MRILKSHGLCRWHSKEPGDNQQGLGRAGKASVKGLGRQVEKIGKWWTRSGSPVWVSSQYLCSQLSLLHPSPQVGSASSILFTGTHLDLRRELSACTITAWVTFELLPSTRKAGSTHENDHPAVVLLKHNWTTLATVPSHPQQQQTPNCDPFTRVPSLYR